MYIRRDVQNDQNMHGVSRDIQSASYSMLYIGSDVVHSDVVHNEYIARLG